MGGEEQVPVGDRDNSTGMAWWIIAILLILVSFTMYTLGEVEGFEIGWKERVNYEAQQCLDHGRCFH